MPNPVRLETPGHPLHVIQRGRLRAACFFGEDDCIEYLAWLAEYAARYACSVHAYVLMGNHLHLLLTPSRAGGVAGLMRSLNGRHADYVAATHHRDGPLWADRYEAIPVHVGRYLLSTMRYIELNPVRARVVARPGQYQWSSFRANALGQNDALLTPHAHYCALGRDAESRQAAYRALFQENASTVPSSRAKVRIPAGGS